MIRKLVALCLIAGCTMETPVAVTPAAVAATEYTCADGAKISAVYAQAEPSQAIVTVDGKTATLTQEVAASGVRYADKSSASKFVWWTKGDQGTLYVKKAGDEEILHGECAAK
jgi:membrane-bound inhibitor of C-type lysozyme